MPIRKLKIVHINTHDIAGGAAKVAWRLAEAQRRNGHDARMLVGIKMSSSEFSTAFDPLADLSKQDGFSKEGLLYYEFLGSHNLVFHPLIRDADVIHLHNLHGNYFNYFSIPLLAAIKPVVWTLHDMHAFTGHCAHSFDCQRWRIGCGNCPRLDIEPAVAVDRTREMLDHKRSIYEHSVVSIVNPSEWLHKKVQCSVLSGQYAEYISNGVDTAVFKPYPKVRARQRFNLPVDALLIGASAHGGALANQWKGGETTLSVLHNILPQYTNVLFINIGSDSLSDNYQIINIPHQQDEASLAEAYSCLDMMLYTPIADNCPLVVLEALSCGVPMVTTHTGGVSELVQNGIEGFVVADRDVNSLVARIEELLASNQLRTDFSLNARKKAVRFFDHSEMALKYEDLYNHSISQWQANCHPERFGLADYPPPEIITRHYEAAVHEVSEYAVLKEETPMDCSPANLPTLSLVVATKNRAQLLDGMLASARESARSISMEIIVIDGGSDDRTLEVLTAHQADVILNELGELGPGRHSWPELYNCGFSKARGKWTMYASDDIEFGPGCLDNAIQVLESCDDSVAGGIFYYRNDIAEPGWDQFGIDYTYGRKMLLNYGVVRTDHFREVQGLDEAYQFYCADGDLCLKLYQRGYDLIPLSECFVVHHNELDMSKHINLERAERDIQCYSERWRGSFSTEIPEPYRLFWEYNPQQPEQSENCHEFIPHTYREEICLHRGYPIKILYDLNCACYDNSDAGTNGEYKVIDALIGSNDVVFDVGANKGHWSERVLLTRQNIRLYAFEPVREIFETLGKALRNTGASLANTALSNKDGTSIFYYYDNNPKLAEMSSLYRRPLVERDLGLHSSPITVITQRLDTFCQEHHITYIDFLKIDTEGAEYDVLLGAQEMLSRGSIGFVQLEYGGTYIDAGISLKKVFKLLSGFGYGIFQITPEGLLSMETWQDAFETYRYSNYVGINPQLYEKIQQNKMIPPNAFHDRQLHNNRLPLRLHLGCGENYLDGYINIDYPPSEHSVMKVKADRYADITTLEYPAGTVDEIRLHHVFEHFNRVTALCLLIRWHEWLKPGGRLMIETPDMEGSAKILLSDLPWHVKTATIRHLAGDQADTWAYHLDHWFPERFQRTLSRLGFTNIETVSSHWPHEPYLANVTSTAVKGPELTRDEQLLAADFILWESTVNPSEKKMFSVWQKQVRVFLSDRKVTQIRPTPVFRNAVQMS